MIFDIGNILKKRKLTVSENIFMTEASLTNIKTELLKRLKKTTKDEEIEKTVKYRKTKGLISYTDTKKYSSRSSYSTTPDGNKTNTDILITKYQGKIDRALAKAEKWMFKKFYKKKTPAKDGNSIIDKVLGVKTVKPPKVNPKPKYSAKVKMPNGKTRYFYSHEEYLDYSKRVAAQKNEPEYMKKLKKIDPNKVYTAEEDQKMTNPKYSPASDAYSNNCFKCTVAYDLRRRGYDVEAREYTDDQTRYTMDKYYVNPKFKRLKSNGDIEDIDSKTYHPLNIFSDNRHVSRDYSGKDLKKALEKNNPPGSRGNLMVYWNLSGGHSMVYEIDHKGKAIIRDAQTNKIQNMNYIASNSKEINFVRTDNLKLKRRVLDAVRNRE